MELVIEELSGVGLVKLSRVFDEQIEELHIRKGVDNVTVILRDSNKWIINTEVWGVEIYNCKSGTGVKLRNNDYVSIIIQ